MEKDLEFSSAVCTSRVQSERLLALGLKKETADVIIPIKFNPDKFPTFVPQDFWISDDPFYRNIREGSIPAWSLGRLVEIINKCNFESFESDTWRKEAKKFCRYILVSYSDDLIETSIEIIETLIQKRYFNKEYLEK